MNAVNNRREVKRPLKTLEKNLLSMSDTLTRHHLTLSREPKNLAERWRTMSAAVEKDAQSDSLKKIDQLLGDENPDIRTRTQNFRDGLLSFRDALESGAKSIEAGADPTATSRDVLASQDGPFRSFAELSYEALSVVRQMSSTITREPVGKDGASLS